MDVMLTLTIGLSQLILSIVGAYMSWDEKHRWKLCSTFIVVGVIGIGATAWYAKRGSDSQEQLAFLIKKESGDTKKTITDWQTSADSAAAKLLLPPRTLTSVQTERLAGILRKHAPTEITLRNSKGSLECQQYADQFAEAIKKGGWKIKEKPKQMMQVREIQGIRVMIKNADKVPLAANYLRDALTSAGLVTIGEECPILDQDDVNLMIGLQ